MGVRESELRRLLLRWYDANARPLPWRRTRDAYRIWVSEVMLQQTRVSVVKDAYRSFLRAFPTLSRLASASEDDVLSLWSGLGYYSRARALHRAACVLREAGARTFPDDLDAALALPGVGEYTAAAVLSIAYGRPHPAVDGNVTRVLSRLGCLDRAEDARRFATELLDRRRPGDWNQAVMELGQTICLPRSPSCDRCPLRTHCHAHRRGRVLLHPEPRRRRASERIALRLTLVQDRKGRFLLQRGAFPYLPHMWLPPIRIRSADANGTRPSFRHAILHRLFDVEVDRAVLSARELEGRARRASPGAESALFSADDLRRIGRSALLAKALRVSSP